LPGKEVKSLKNSRLDRFANNIQINFDLAANAQVKAMETIEHRQRDIGFWHL
jgi:DNA topoisomerase VI subunit B